MYELITPYSKEYGMARNQWNRAIEAYPKAICYCRSLRDIEKAVYTAVNHEYDMRIRSGGHNYEGFSTGTHTFVIDISQLNQVTVNLEHRTVTMQGGALNATIYHTLAKLGFPFPGGTCPGVSVSGFTLGGGWGYSARKYGLGIDSLLELKMINYEGKLLTANACRNKDLFWACRGAGAQNFGIATEFTFQLPSPNQSLLLFELTVPDASLEDQVQFLDTWQQFIPSADRNINMNGGIYQSAKNGFYNYLRGFYYGTREQLAIVLQPFTALPGCVLTVWDESPIQNIDRVFASYLPYERFKSGGRFVNQTYPLSTLTALAQIVREPLPAGSQLISINVFGLGGAVSDVRPEETAFYYRDSNYILQVQSIYSSNQVKAVNDAWVISKYQYLQTITSGSYVNFPFTPLSDYMSAYYGENQHRLYQIKQKYDPNNYFHFEQSIPLCI